MEQAGFIVSATSPDGTLAEIVELKDHPYMIATQAHRAALDRRLTLQGLDLVSARSNQLYIDLDAEQSLAKFIVDGWPDDELFVAFVGDVLKRARSGGRRVRAFGEMVALLWARGDHSATVRLEHIWHRLCATESFSLFCAYPKVGFTENAATSIDLLCAAHSKVFPNYPQS